MGREGSMVVSTVNDAGEAASSMGRDAAARLKFFDRRILLRASRLRRDKQDVPPTERQLRRDESGFTGGNKPQIAGM